MRDCFCGKDGMGDGRTLIRCKACESSSEKKLLLQVVFRADEARQEPNYFLYIPHHRTTGRTPENSSSAACHQAS